MHDDDTWSWDLSQQEISQILNKLFLYIFWTNCSYIYIYNLILKIKSLDWQVWRYLSTLHLSVLCLDMQNNRILHMQSKQWLFTVTSIEFCTFVDNECESTHDCILDLVAFKNTSGKHSHSHSHFYPYVHQDLNYTIKTVCIEMWNITLTCKVILVSISTFLAKNL